ncbi:methionine synthase [Actinomyces radicidentis]|uniref:Methionine synthase n=1 Tax=Actinomyces radicidentis TaxID=111015 RepID=A0A109W2W7_ACTRD|nr:cobalamin-independent methionine synthase II family protein [Actinomyces radicidentis]AMD87738.1 methionine synthase [Actinomyces radicidentis]
MTTRIRTTHVGSLPRTQALTDAKDSYLAGSLGRASLDEVVATETAGVVKRQIDLGLDVVNDGEYGHIAVGGDYTAWMLYAYRRVSGVTPQDPAHPDYVPATIRPSRSRTTSIHLAEWTQHRDWLAFDEAYGDPGSGTLFGGAEDVSAAFFKGEGGPLLPAVTSAVTYTGADDVARDLAATRAALEANGLTPGSAFISALSPGSAGRLDDGFYEYDDDQVNAFADALHHEYKAITDAGFTLQLDAPDLADTWDLFNPQPSLADYRAFTQVRIDAINRALEGIDPAQVRLHVCWGSWHGPHSTDIPFRDIVDLALQVNANGLSFEAANVRHEHEWKIWKDIVDNGQLPEERYLVPGCVSHVTNVLEHPELVADRITRFAEVVGPERVVASTDCGLGGRVHGQIAWAKLASLTEGARIASERF